MDIQNGPRALAVAYIEAVGQKQFDRFADSRRLSYGTTCTPRSSTANDVAVLYDFVTDTPAGTVPTIEWITVDAGQIRTSRLIFHKEHWPAAVAELTRRAPVA